MTILCLIYFLYIDSLYRVYQKKVDTHVKPSQMNIL